MVMTQKRHFLVGATFGLFSSFFFFFLFFFLVRTTWQPWIFSPWGCAASPGLWDHCPSLPAYLPKRMSRNPISTVRTTYKVRIAYQSPTEHTSAGPRYALQRSMASASALCPHKLSARRPKSPSPLRTYCCPTRRGFFSRIDGLGEGGYVDARRRPPYSQFDLCQCVLPGRSVGRSVKPERAIGLPRFLSASWSRQVATLGQAIPIKATNSRGRSAQRH